MHLKNIQLRNFRNYSEADLSLDSGLSVIYGNNAQGKSNFLEAVYMLAILKSNRTDRDRDLLQMAPKGQPVFTRVVGDGVRNNGSVSRVRIDMAITPSQRGDIFRKQVRENGIPKSAIDAIGAIPIVLFSVDDLEVIHGSPSLRRRNLDILLSQMDSKYVRALREYQKIINQRNHLLKRIRDNFARLDELHFWDNEMVNQGATIISIRASAIDFLKSIVIDKYAKMSHENELVSMTYVPSFSIPGNNIDELKEKFLQLLNEVRTKELAIGQTMIGPHRDDIKFEINGMSAGRFGSRGQIRCVALALRFAEAHFMDISLGDSPIILLDDILSELDDVRRNDVLRSASSYQQVLLTTAVPIDQYLKDYSSNIFNIKNGRIAPQGTS